MKSRPVFVLGMHRSGTSFLASIVRALGVNMGEKLLEADEGNRRGYFEDAEIIAFHDRLLSARLGNGDMHGSFLVPRDFSFSPTPEERDEACRLIRERVARGGIWGWKDPRCCLFLNMWAELLPDAHFVAVYRNPLEVFYSFLKRKDWAALLSPAAVFESYSVYNRSIVAAGDAAPERFLVLNAQRAFSDIPKLVDALCAFIGVPVPDVSALPEFASKEFSSLSTSVEQYRLMAAVYPAAAEAFEAVQKLSMEPEVFDPVGKGDSRLAPGLVSSLADWAVGQSAAQGGAGAPGLHGLLEAVCLNVSPETLVRLKGDIVASLDSSREQLRDERDHYVGLYNNYFPLYENYFNAWQGTSATLDGTRRWIVSDLMPLALMTDGDSGRVSQYADLSRMLLAQETGPMTVENAARRHSALPREGNAFNQALMGEGWEPALGATSSQEQLYAEWAARNVDLSEGAIVDLGSWLGSFSVALARGAEANPTAKVRIDAGEKIVHAFDLFTWHEGFDSWVCGTPHEGKYRPGDDFSEAFRYETREFSRTIEMHKADLSRAEWRGGAIPLLINDSWKTLPIADSAVHAFFPCLKPGSILMNQDYLWCTESFIHVYMYRLRAFFEPLYQVPNATSVVFMCRETPGRIPPLPFRFEDISEEEIEATFHWSAGFVDRIARQVLPLGHAWLLAQKGLNDRAKVLAASVLHTRDINHGFIRWEIDGLRNAGFGWLFE